MSKRQKIGARLRFEVLSRDGFKCVYCGGTERLHIDHMTPVSEGGTNRIGNLATACRECNLGKAATTSWTTTGLQRFDQLASSVTMILRGRFGGDWQDLQSEIVSALVDGVSLDELKAAACEVESADLFLRMMWRWRCEALEEDRREYLEEIRLQ